MKLKWFKDKPKTFHLKLAILGAFSEENKRRSAVFLNHLNTQKCTGQPCNMGSFGGVAQGKRHSLSYEVHEVLNSNKFSSLVAKHANILLVCYDQFDETTIQKAYAQVALLLAEDCQIYLLGLPEHLSAEDKLFLRADALMSQWQQASLDLYKIEELNFLFSSILKEALIHRGLSESHADDLAEQAKHTLGKEKAIADMAL